ncbi:DoxX family protein [Vibrio sp. ED004]|uniref:DoxX family protein n=1 Tax=unclassified Vibrio TaxID=2614977 RepID=UPI000302DAD4|nr:MULTISPECIES: DoxX family protein [unclassified Vibrio]UPR59918.1 DoxX family protein [Vibrio sp. ED004]
MNTVVSILMVMFFVLASSIKTLGWQKKVFEIQLGFFKSYGLNRMIMFLVGLVELTGAVLLILALSDILPEQTQVMGGAILGATSIGALYFHLRFDTWKYGIPAIVTLLCSSFLVLGLWY